MIIFHIIGAIGIKLYPDVFLKASVFNLMLSVFCVFAFSKLKTNNFLLLGLLALLALIIEIVGVSTGLPFGSYYYGNNLGPKLFNVPLIIGVNWILLLYCCNVLFREQNILVAAFYSAICMVLLDFLMEQNVEKLGFWFWENHVVPLQNYLAWFVISVLFTLVIRKYFKPEENKVAVVFYIVQVVFFAYCYFII